MSFSSETARKCPTRRGLSTYTSGAIGPNVSGETKDLAMLDEPRLLAANPWVTRRPITVVEYHRMGEVGILGKRDRVELIEGELVAMSPIGSYHQGTVNQLTHSLVQSIGEHAVVSVQGPVRLDDFSEPEPDFALLKPRPDFYRAAHPGPSDVLLLIEVADTSLNYDRAVKRALYARHAIPELWIVDLNAGEVEIRRQPDAAAIRRSRASTGTASSSRTCCPGSASRPRHCFAERTTMPDTTVTEIKPLSRVEMAARVARDIPEGWYVNLGIGIPTAIADHVPLDREVIFHSENGVLGMGPAPPKDKIDPWLINAGKQYVTLRQGGSFCHHADSFSMIRGGHLDLCVLGAFQVAENGDIANWATSENDTAPAVGGAMDLAAGAKRLWVLMEHTTKDGAPKLVQRCSYPLTAVGAVKRVYTNLAALDVTDRGFVVIDMAPGLTFDALQARTDAPLHRSA
jgi:3-oxoadipate CoA-transferase, beta subunit